MEPGERDVHLGRAGRLPLLVDVAAVKADYSSFMIEGQLVSELRRHVSERGSSHDTRQVEAVLRKRAGVRHRGRQPPLHSGLADHARHLQGDSKAAHALHLGAGPTVALARLAWYEAHLVDFGRRAVDPHLRRPIIDLVSLFHGVEVTVRIEAAEGVPGCLAWLRDEAVGIENRELPFGLKDKAFGLDDEVYVERLLPDLLTATLERDGVLGALWDIELPAGGDPPPERHCDARVGRTYHGREVK